MTWKDSERTKESRIRRFLKAPVMAKVSSMVGTNLLVPLIALLVAPVMARELGAEGRGIYTALTAPVLLAGIVGTLGLQDGLTQFVSRRGLPPRDGLRLAAFSVLFLSIVTASAMWTLGYFLFEDNDLRLEYSLALTTIPVLIGHNLIIGIATGSRDFRGLNVAKLLPAVVRAVVVVVLCLLTDMTPLAAALILLASPALGIFWQSWRVLRTPPPTNIGGMSPPDRSTRKLFRFSIAAFPGVLAAMAMSRADQVLGLPLLGAEQLGYYAIAVTVAEVPMMIATAGRSYIIGLDISERSSESAPRLAGLIMVVNAVLCLALIAVIPWVIPFVFGSDFTGAVIPCMILLIGTICFTAMSLGSAILLSNGQAHAQSLAYITAACVSLALLFAFSRLGAVGAATASVAGYAVASVLSWTLVRRSFSSGQPRHINQARRSATAHLTSSGEIESPKRPPISL